MRISSWALFSVFLLVHGFLFVSESRGFDDALIEKFRNDAEQAWIRHHELAHRTSGSRGLEIISTRTNLPGTARDRSAWIDDHYTLAETEREKDGGPQITHVKNPSYSFDLGRSKISNKWVVQKVVRVGSAEESSIGPPPGKKKSMMHGRFLDNMDTFFAIPNLVLKGADQVEFDGTKCVSVMFSFPQMERVYLRRDSGPGKPVDFRDVVHDCEAIFDPERYWLIRKLSGRINGGMQPLESYEATFQYDCSFDGLPRLISKSYSVSKNSLAPIPGVKVTFEYGWVTPEDFTLTAFGFKEPDWYQPPRPWWLYSSLIGMGLLAIGAIVLRYGKSLWNQH